MTPQLILTARGRPLHISPSLAAVASSPDGMVLMVWCRGGGLAGRACLRLPVGWGPRLPSRLRLTTGTSGSVRQPASQHEGLGQQPDRPLYVASCLFCSSGDHVDEAPAARLPDLRRARTEGGRGSEP